MKTKVIKNEDRKTITVVLSPIVIGYTDYLFEKYNGERYFASGVLKGVDYNALKPIVKEILDALNDVAEGVLPKGEKFVGSDLLTLKEDEFRLFSKNTNKDGEWDGQFKINLSSKAKGDKRFLFKDVECKIPIDEDDGWKHYYAVEVEISVGYNEDEFKSYTYSIFHRGISVGEREANSFKQNDSAFDGFDFDVEEDEENDEYYETSKQLASEEDLPF